MSTFGFEYIADANTHEGETQTYPVANFAEATKRFETDLTSTVDYGYHHDIRALWQEHDGTVAFNVNYAFNITESITYSYTP